MTVGITCSGFAGRGIFRSLAFAVLCTLVVCSGCYLKVDEKPVKVKLLDLIDPAYLEILVLSEEPDASHDIPVLGPEGRVWYRTREPVLDLSHFEFDRSREDIAHDGSPAIALYVKERHGERLDSWTRNHIGEWCGVAFDGRLFSVAKVMASIRTRMQVSGFESLEHMQEVLQALHAGGEPPSNRPDATSRPADFDPSRLIVPSHATSTAIPIGSHVIRERKRDVFEVLRVRAIVRIQHAIPLTDEKGDLSGYRTEPTDSRPAEPALHVLGELALERFSSLEAAAAAIDAGRLTVISDSTIWAIPTEASRRWVVYEP